MRQRTLKILKRTPIAIAMCETCRMEFHSYAREEDEAEQEMQSLFESHSCELSQPLRAHTAGGSES
jgi:hypothetical protein